MPRLLLVPQLPIHLRYQEWWYKELPQNYQKYFNEVVILGGGIDSVIIEQGAFSVAEQAARYEASQIAQYMSLKLLDDDVLLFCDLSYPGLFAHVLWHKRPSKVFAICHASARNAYDIFAPVRKGKFAVESRMAGLCDAVFVGSHYHAKKLGWPNTVVAPLPYPPYKPKILGRILPSLPLVTVARKGIQKRTPRLERIARKAVGAQNIELPSNIFISSWAMYFCELSRYHMMLSTAKEETFGYQIVDAILCGTIPIAPNRFSYPELLPREYLYDDEKELVRILQSNHTVPKLLCHDDMLQFYQNTARRMLQ